MIETIKWNDGKLELIDQRKLPLTKEYVLVSNLEDTFNSIELMIVRGAPLIGFTALFGLVVHLNNDDTLSLEKLRKDCDYLISSRPTAVNLSYEVNRAYELATEYVQKNSNLKGFASDLEKFAVEQMEKLHASNLQMAKFAAKDLEEKFGTKKLRLMTLCNTGALACGPMGTALGVIEYMNSIDRVEFVYASETRPYLQGARLSAFELQEQGIDHAITVEGAFSYLMRNKLVDAVFIGADRIVANGDTANKIGSSTLAITCKYYGVPFYVVAPTSSFDFSAKTGDEIEIELRDENEILSCQGVRIAPEKSKAYNPSFDVTDSSLIEGIICEKKLLKAPYVESISEIFSN